MSGDTLRKSGITSVKDLAKVVPGLHFSSVNSKSPAIFIRGIGQRESNAALDPGVVVYINGIYIPRADSQLLDTVDTESIQVLRGPQGTLFGKNSTGGAMLITTKKPDTEASEVTLSTRLGNNGRRDAGMIGNMPLSDDMAVRMALNSVKSTMVI